jgi:predicted nucleic acid-binding protein
VNAAFFDTNIIFYAASGGETAKRETARGLLQSRRVVVSTQVLMEIYASLLKKLKLTPDEARLWVDMVAHVAMGRDKRTYRFLQDTVHGRRVLAESTDVEPIVEAVTRYVARRIVARSSSVVFARISIRCTSSSDIASSHRDQGAAIIHPWSLAFDNPDKLCPAPIG